MSLNLGTTQIIIRKKVGADDAKNIVCSEVISDVQGKRKFVGAIPTDFPSGELDDNTGDVETDVIIKIGDVELSRKEIGASLNVPTIPTILVDNTPPEIKIDFQGIDGQNIKLTFDYIADENIVVDESDPTAKINGKGKFQLDSDGGSGQRNRGKSNRHMPGTTQNTRKPGKNFTFTVIALPYHEGNLYYVEQNGAEWNYVQEIDESGFSDSGFVKTFIKNQLTKKANKSIAGVHNQEYLPIVEYEIAQDVSDGNAHKIKIKNASNFIEQDPTNNLVSLTLSSTADLIEGYTGLFKVFAVGSDHINNFSPMTVVSTSEVDNTIRVLDIEPPIAQLTSANESSDGIPSISVSGYYYDLVTPVNSYLLVVDQDYDINTYTEVYNFDGISANKITNGQSLKSIMESIPSAQIATESLVVDSGTGTFSSTILNYYNTSTNSMESIITGKSYFVYMLVSETGSGIGSTESFYQNNVFSKSAQISFLQSIQDFTVTTDGISPPSYTNRTIMYKDKTINFKWNMTFDHADASELQLHMIDKDGNSISLPLSTSDASYDYASSYTIADETLFNNGRIQFSLVYTPISQTFNESSITNELYFQNRVDLSDADSLDSWYLSANTNSPSLRHNILNINNVYSVIEKNMTIETNPYVMSGLSFTFTVYKDDVVFQTINNVSRVSSSSYNNLPLSLQVSGLDEQTDYNIKLGISFTFESVVNISTITNNSSLNTGFDVPTISSIGIRNQASASIIGNMSINAPSYEILDKTSTVNTYAFYIRTLDNGSFTDQQLYTFARDQGNNAGIIAVDTNYDPGLNKEIKGLSAYTYYYTTSFTPEPLSKNIDSYIFVIIAEDNAPGVKNYVVHRTDPVIFTALKQMTINSITTTNDRSPNIFAKNLNDITINYRTTFAAVTSDFNIRIFASSITPSSLDGRNWTFTTTVPDDWVIDNFFGSSVINTFTYVDEDKKPQFDTNSLYIKVSDPVIDFTDDNIITGDSNLSDRRFQFQNIDVNEFNPFYTETDGLAYTGYSFKFTAFNSKGSTFIDLSTSGDIGTVEHLTTALVQSRFDAVAITSLEMGEIYTIRLDVTDPAGNIFTSTPFTLRTYDTQGITLELDGLAQPNSSFIDPTLVQPTYNLSGYAYDNVDIFNLYLIVSSQHIDEAQMYVMTSDADHQSIFLVDNYVPGALTESNSQWSVSNIQSEYTISTDGTNTISEAPIKSEQLYYAYVISRQLDGSNVEIDSEDSVNFNKIALATFQQIATVDSFVSDNTVSTAFAENSNNIILTLDAFRYLEHESNMHIQYKIYDVLGSLIETHTPTIEHQTRINVSVNDNKFVFDPMPSRFIQGLTYVFDQSDGTNATHPLGYLLEDHVGGVAGLTDGVNPYGTPGSADAYTEITFNDASNVSVYFICETHFSDMGSVLKTTINDMTGSRGFQVVEDDGLNTIWKATMNTSSAEIGKLNYSFALNRDIENVIALSNDPAEFITVQHQLELQPFNVNYTHDSFTITNLGQMINSATSPTLELFDFNAVEGFSIFIGDGLIQYKIYPDVFDTPPINKAELESFTFTKSNLIEGETIYLMIRITDIYGNSDTVSTFTIDNAGSNVDSFTLLSSPPTIVTTPPIVSTSGDITVSTSATFNDEHSSFTSYMALVQGHISSYTQSELVSFFTSGIANILIQPGTKNTDLVSTPTFTGFFDNITTPVFRNDIVPTDGTDFTVLYYVVDNSIQNNKVYSSSQVSFVYSDYCTNISLVSNTTTAPFSKFGDVITLSWTSKYISTSNIFNVTINDVVVSAVDSGSGSSWTATYTVPNDITTNKLVNFNISVVGNNFNTVSSGNPIYIDNVKPVYSIDLIGDQKEIGTIKLENLVFSSSLPTGYPTGTLDGTDSSLLGQYTFTITATSTVGIDKTETKTLSAWGYVDNSTTFRVTGLTAGENYNVVTSMTDPTGHDSGTVNPSITTFQVKDVAGPIFQEGTDEAMVLVAQTPINYQEYIVGNINVIDLHSSYDVHVALFESRSNPDFTALRTIAQTSTNTQSFLNNPAVRVTSDPNYNGPFQTQPFNSYIDIGGIEVTGSNVFTVGKDYTFLAYALDSAGNFSTDFKTLTITTQAAPVYNPTEEEKPEVEGVADEDVVGQTTEVDENTGTSTTVDESGNTITGNDKTTATENEDGTVTNSFEEGGALIADENNNPLYDDSSGTTEPEPQFTRSFETVTPTSLPSESNPSPQYLESMDEDHYIRFNSDGQIELKWGGSNSEPLVAPIEIENGVSYDISYTVNTETNTISIIVDGTAYEMTTEDVSTPADSALVTGGFANDGETSDIGNSFVGSMETPTTITVALSETQVNSYLSGTKKLMEFTFDNFQEGASNEQFQSTVSTISIPLVVVGSSALIDIEYPRVGKGAYQLDSSYHLEADIPADALTSVSMSVMFWYKSISNAFGSDLIRLESSSNDDFVKIGLSNNKMTVAFDDSDGVHTDASQTFTPLSPNTWNHLAYVFIANNIYFYLNGQYIGGGLDHVHDSFQFRKMIVGGGASPQGSIDMLSVYRTKLTRTAIVQNINEALHKRMVLRYDFENTDGTKVFDESRSLANTATMHADPATSIVTNAPISQHAMRFDGIDDHIELYGSSELDLSNLQHATFTCFVQTEEDSIGSKPYIPILHKENSYKLGIDFTNSDSGANRKGIAKLEMYNHVRGAYENLPSINPKEGLPALMSQHIRISGQTNYFPPVAEFKFEDNSYSMTTTSTTILPSSTGIVFDESTDIVNLGPSVLSNTDEELTLSMWVKVKQEDMHKNMALMSMDGAFTMGLNNGSPYFMTAPEFFPGYTKEISTNEVPIEPKVVGSLDLRSETPSTTNHLSTGELEFNYTTFTISYWIKFNEFANPTNNIMLPSMFRSSVNTYRAIYIWKNSSTDSNHMNARIRIGSGSACYSEYLDWYTDTWYHIVVGIDNSTGNNQSPHIYVNGSGPLAPGGTFQVNGTDGNITDLKFGVQGFVFGEMQSYLHDYKISDFQAFSGTKLSATQVNELYTTNKVTDLVPTYHWEFYENFNDTTGTYPFQVLDPTGMTATFSSTEADIHPNIPPEEVIPSTTDPIVTGIAINSEVVLTNTSLPIDEALQFKYVNGTNKSILAIGMGGEISSSNVGVLASSVRLTNAEVETIGTTPIRTEVIDNGNSQVYRLTNNSTTDPYDTSIANITTTSPSIVSISEKYDSLRNYYSLFNDDITSSHSNLYISKGNQACSFLQFDLGASYLITDLVFTESVLHQNLISRQYIFVSDSPIANFDGSADAIGGQLAETTYFNTNLDTIISGLSESIQYFYNQAFFDNSPIPINLVGRYVKVYTFPKSTNHYTGYSEIYVYGKLVNLENYSYSVPRVNTELNTYYNGSSSVSMDSLTESTLYMYRLVGDQISSKTLDLTDESNLLYRLTNNGTTDPYDTSVANITTTSPSIVSISEKYDSIRDYYTFFDDNINASHNNTYVSKNGSCAFLQFDLGSNYLITDLVFTESVMHQNLISHQHIFVSDSPIANFDGSADAIGGQLAETTYFNDNMDTILSGLSESIQYFYNQAFFDNSPIPINSVGRYVKVYTFPKTANNYHGYSEIYAYGSTSYDAKSLSPLTMYNIASYTPISTKQDLFNKIELELEKNPDLGVVFTEANATASTVATVSNVDFNGTAVPITAVPSAYVYTLATDGTLADVKLGNALVQTKGLSDTAVTISTEQVFTSISEITQTETSITITKGSIFSESTTDDNWVFLMNNVDPTIFSDSNLEVTLETFVEQFLSIQTLPTTSVYKGSTTDNFINLNGVTLNKAFNSFTSVSPFDLVDGNSYVALAVARLGVKYYMTMFGDDGTPLISDIDVLFSTKNLKIATGDVNIKPNSFGINPVINVVISETELSEADLDKLVAEGKTTGNTILTPTIDETQPLLCLTGQTTHFSYGTLTNPTNDLFDIVTANPNGRPVDRVSLIQSWCDDNGATSGAYFIGNAFDGSLTTRWMLDRVSPPYHMFQLDFGTSYSLDRLELYTPISTNYPFNQIFVFASDDESLINELPDADHTAEGQSYTFFGNIDAYLSHPTFTLALTDKIGATITTQYNSVHFIPLNNIQGRFIRVYTKATGAHGMIYQIYAFGRESHTATSYESMSNLSIDMSTIYNASSSSMVAIDSLPSELSNVYIHSFISNASRSLVSKYIISSFTRDTSGQTNELLCLTGQTTHPSYGTLTNPTNDLFDIVTANTVTSRSVDRVSLIQSWCDDNGATSGAYFIGNAFDGLFTTNWQLDRLSPPYHMFQLDFGTSYKLDRLEIYTPMSVNYHFDQIFVFASDDESLINELPDADHTAKGQTYTFFGDIDAYLSHPTFKLALTDKIGLNTTSYYNSVHFIPLNNIQGRFIRVYTKATGAHGIIHQIYAFGSMLSPSTGPTPTTTTQFLNWDATVDSSTAFSRVVVEDYSITQSDITDSSVLTINSGHAVTNGTAFDNVWVFAVVPPVVEPATIPYNNISPSDIRSQPSTNQIVSAIDDYGVELSETGWKGFSPNLHLIPKIGDFYDFEAYIDGTISANNDLIIGLIDATIPHNFAHGSFNQIIGSTSPTINLGWYFEFRSNKVYVNHLGGYNDASTNEISDWNSFPQYHRIKFVETSVVSGATGVYSLIYELYSDPERTILVKELPANDTGLVRGYTLNPSDLSPIPLSIFTNLSNSANPAIFKNLYRNTDIPEPSPPFTSTDLQTMASLYTRVATEGEAYHTFTNETAVSFENKTFTHAFSSIDGAATELLTTDGDYTVVAVGEQAGEYYAGYANVVPNSTPVAHLELDISSYNAGTVNNIGDRAISNQIDIHNNGTFGSDADGDYIHLDNTQYIVLDSEVPILSTAQTDFTVFHSFKRQASAQYDSPFLLYGTTSPPLARMFLNRQGNSGNIFKFAFGVDQVTSSSITIPENELVNMIMTYKYSTNEFKYEVNLMSTGTTVTDTLTGVIDSSLFRTLVINASLGEAAHTIGNQQLYAFKLYAKHLDELTEEYDNFANGTVAPPPPPTITTQSLTWTPSGSNLVTSRVAIDDYSIGNAGGVEEYQGIANQADASNGSATQEDISVVFDYDASTTDYTTGAALTSYQSLAKTTLQNGDNFYSSKIGAGTGGSLVNVNIGTFFDGNTTTTVSSTNFVRRNIVPAAGLSQFWFYYEPSEYVYVNEFTVHAYGETTLANLFSLEVYNGEDGSLTSVTNPSPSLPHSIPSAYSTLGEYVMQFDWVVIGPNKPMKIVFQQVQDAMGFSEFKFRYDGSASVPPPTNKVLTVNSGYAVTDGTAFDNVWVFAVAGSLDTPGSPVYTALDVNSRSTHTRTTGGTTLSPATAIDDYEITIGNYNSWGAFHPDITLTPTIGNYYDFEAYVERNDMSRGSDMVIALYTETSHNYGDTSFSSANGGDVNVGWFFKFETIAPEVKMAYIQPSSGASTSLNVTWDDFPIYHRIKFVDKTEVPATASSSVAYSVIYELYSDPERTQLEFELPIGNQYVVGSYTFNPTTFDPIPLSIFSHGVSVNKIHFKNFRGKDDITPTILASPTQLQDMASLYTRVATEGEAYHTFTNETALSFENKTFTHAFSSIDGAATELLTADGDYTVVAVGEQAGEYYAGYANILKEPEVEVEVKPIPSEHIGTGWSTEVLSVDGTNRTFHTRVLGGVTYHIWASDYLGGNYEGYHAFRYTHNEYNGGVSNYQASATQNGWHTTTTANYPVTWVMKMSQAINILSYFFGIRGGSLADYDPNSWTMYVSNDGITWTLIDEQNDTWNDYSRAQPGVREITLSTPYDGLYTWVKFIFEDQGGSHNIISIRDLRFKATTELSEIIPPTVTTQSLTWTPSGSNLVTSRVAIDDYSISDSNVLTVNSGYAVTDGTAFDNVWVFAVVPQIDATRTGETTVNETITSDDNYDHSIRATTTGYSTIFDNGYNQDLPGGDRLYVTPGRNNWGGVDRNVSFSFSENPSYAWTFYQANYEDLSGLEYVFTNDEIKTVDRIYFAFHPTDTNSWPGRITIKHLDDTGVFVESVTKNTYGVITVNNYTYEIRFDSALATNKIQIFFSFGDGVSGTANADMSVYELRFFYTYTSSTIPFTSTQLQTMAKLFINPVLATEGEAYHTFTNETALSFENKTFTHAFSSIDGAATELLTTDGDYTVVAVGEQGGEYYAGYANVTISDPLDILYDVPEGNRTFSSHFTTDNLQYSQLSSSTSWASSSATTGGFVEMDLGSNYMVSGVVTAGRNTTYTTQYVTSIKVETSLDGSTWTTILEDATANDAPLTEVTNKFPNVVSARHVKITVLTYNSYPSMRCGVLYQDLSSQPPTITTQSLTWTPSGSNLVTYRVAIDDYSISDSNVLTINSGYAVTDGTAFDNVWVFAVKGNGAGEESTANAELLQEHMLAYYNAYQPDAISGTTIKDYSGNGKDATMTQGTTEIVDNAFVFDGSNWLLLDNLENPPGSWSHSVSIWLQMDQFPVASGFENFPWLINTSQATGAISGLFQNSSGFHFSMYSLNLGFGNNPTLTLTNNVWYHITCVFDGNEGTYGTQYVYVDGTLVGENAISSSFNIVGNTTLNIGRVNLSGTGDEFQGKIRTIAVYDKALTAGEVTALYDYEMATPGVIYPPGVPAWTSTDLQDMASLYTRVATEGEAYHTFTNETIMSFENKTFTHAFSSIDGAATEAIAADGQYTVVAVGEQGGEYYAGYMHKVEIIDPQPTPTITIVPEGSTIEESRGAALDATRYTNFTTNDVDLNTTTFKNGTQSLYFNSTSSYIALGPNDFMGTRKSWSTSFWYQATTTNTQDILYFKFGSDAYRIIIQLTTDANPFRFLAIAGGSSPMDDYINVGTFVNTWLHIALVHEVNGSTTTTRGYVNGVLEATGSFSNTAITASALDTDSRYTLTRSSSFEYVFGNRVGDVYAEQSYFDEIKLYDHALTDAEVVLSQNLYSTIVPTTTTTQSLTWTPSGSNLVTSRVAIDDYSISDSNVLTINSGYAVTDGSVADGTAFDNVWVFAVKPDFLTASATMTVGSDELIEFYFKNTDGTSSYGLVISEVTLYSDSDYTGDVVDYTVTAIDKSINHSPDNNIGQNTSQLHTYLTDGINGGIYWTDAATKPTATYSRYFTITPNAPIMSVEITCLFLHAAPEIKLVQGSTIKEHGYIANLFSGQASNWAGGASGADPASSNQIKYASMNLGIEQTDPTYIPIETQLQDMVSTHITSGTEGTHYHTYTDVAIQSFNGETLTGAFSSIDSNGTELLTADGEYTVVAVGEQTIGGNTEYYAGYMNAIEGSVASEEWVLVVRDYPSTSQFAQYANSSGDFGTESDLSTAYSRFYSLYSSDTGGGDFNDTEIKSQGYYEFKWIPYFDSGVTNANRVDPETDTLYDGGSAAPRYIQWTQTANPLKTNTGSSGLIPGFSLIDQQNVDVTLGTGGGQFNGLALSSDNATVLDGNGQDGSWWQSCGTISNHAGGIPWSTSSTPSEIQASELYMRKIGTRPISILVPQSLTWS